MLNLLVGFDIAVLKFPAMQQVSSENLFNIERNQEKGKSNK